MINSMSSGIHMTVYQAGLPGLRRDWKDFAEATGGYAVKAKKDNFPEIEQILRDLDQWYLLGYVPDSKTLDQKAEVIDTSSGPRTVYKVQFHSLKVKTKVKNTKVRARESFQNLTLYPGLSRFRPAQAGTGRKVMTSSPFIAGDLSISTEAIPYFSPKQESMIRVVLNVKETNLKFMPEAGKDYDSARVNVVGQLSLDGRMLNSYRGTATFIASRQEQEEAPDIVHTTSFDIPVSEPGLYVLRTSAIQARSGLVGNHDILVEVPDFAKSGLVASGIATYPISKNPEESIELQPVTRKIHLSDSFLCSLNIYNAQRDEATGSAQIESQLRLYKDDRLIQASEVVSVPDQGRDSITKGIAINMGMKPSPELTAGNYLLEVLVIDKLAGKRNNTTAQAIAIELFE